MHEYKDLSVPKSFGIYIAAINFAFNFILIFFFFLWYLFPFIWVWPCRAEQVTVKQIKEFLNKSALKLQEVKVYRIP